MRSLRDECTSCLGPLGPDRPGCLCAECEAEAEAEADDEVFTCWCGVSGTADELLSDDPYLDTCGGTGFLHCHCGGDLCVCHHHGEAIECPGCEDCDGPDDDPDCDPRLDDEAWWDDEGTGEHHRRLRLEDEGEA